MRCHLIVLSLFASSVSTGRAESSVENLRRLQSFPGRQPVGSPVGQPQRPTFFQPSETPAPTLFDENGFGNEEDGPDTGFFGDGDDNTPAPTPVDDDFDEGTPAPTVFDDDRDGTLSPTPFDDDDGERTPAPTSVDEDDEGSSFPTLVDDDEDGTPSPTSFDNSGGEGTLSPTSFDDFGGGFGTPAPSSFDDFGGNFDTPAPTSFDGFNGDFDTPAPTTGDDDNGEVSSPTGEPGNENGGGGSNFGSETPSPTIPTFSSPTRFPASRPTFPTREPSSESGPSGPSIPTFNPPGPTPRPTTAYVSNDDDPLQPVAPLQDDDAWQWTDSTLEEMEHDRSVIIALSVVFGFGICLAIITAHQMIDNPDGICASLCRILASCTCAITRCVCFPCRAACGCTGRDRDRRTHDIMLQDDDHYTHDLELS